MKVTLLSEEEWLSLDDQSNYLTVQNQKEENLFQAEMRNLYGRLVESLSAFGEEGDYYGVSDFTVQPDLRDRPTTKMPPAAHFREFHIMILTEKFHRSDYLPVLHAFLSSEAQAYRAIVAKDFDPTWVLRMALTADLAQVYCTKTEEIIRLQERFAAL